MDLSQRLRTKQDEAQTGSDAQDNESALEEILYPRASRKGSSRGELASRTLRAKDNQASAGRESRERTPILGNDYELRGSPLAKIRDRSAASEDHGELVGEDRTSDALQGLAGPSVDQPHLGTSQRLRDMKSRVADGSLYPDLGELDLRTGYNRPQKGERLTRYATPYPDRNITDGLSEWNEALSDKYRQLSSEHRQLLDRLIAEQNGENDRREILEREHKEDCKNIVDSIYKNRLKEEERRKGYNKALKFWKEKVDNSLLDPNIQDAERLKILLSAQQFASGDAAETMNRESYNERERKDKEVFLK